MAKKDMNDDFPSNSKTSRIAPIRESKRIQEEGALVTTDEKKPRASRVRAMRHKKGFVQSVAEMFVGNGSDNVGGYILYDVLIPAAKSMLQDAVTSGIEMVLFGETRGGSRSRDKDKNRSTVSYGSYYKNRDRDDSRSERRRPSYRNKFDLNEIYFTDHAIAEDVLDELCERLEEYEEVTVAEFFEIAGLEGATWAHEKYGWKDLRKAHFTHTRQGYVILFPDPIELD